jgi:hypothetical protein
MWVFPARGDPERGSILAFTGIPISLRSVVWPHLVDSRRLADASTAAGSYQALQAQPLDTKVQREIQNDVDRTPGYRYTKSGQATLSNVLRAYAARNPEIG